MEKRWETRSEESRGYENAENPSQNTCGAYPGHQDAGTATHGWSRARNQLDLPTLSRLRSLKRDLAILGVEIQGFSEFE